MRRLARLTRDRGPVRRARPGRAGVRRRRHRVRADAPSGGSTPGRCRRCGPPARAARASRSPRSIPASTRRYPSSPERSCRARISATPAATVGPTVTWTRSATVRPWPRSWSPGPVCSTSPVWRRTPGCCRSPFPSRAPRTPPPAITFRTRSAGPSIITPRSSACRLGGRRDPVEDTVPCPADEQSAIDYAVRPGRRSWSRPAAIPGQIGSPVEDPGVCLGRGVGRCGRLARCRGPVLLAPSLPDPGRPGRRHRLPRPRRRGGLPRRGHQPGHGDHVGCHGSRLVEAPVADRPAARHPGARHARPPRADARPRLRLRIAVRRPRGAGGRPRQCTQPRV